MHGLLVDIETGKVEWLVNGYQTLEMMGPRMGEMAKSTGHSMDALKSLGDFELGEMKFPEGKIGETVAHAADWLSGKTPPPATPPPPSAPPAKPAAPPKLPLPPPIRFKSVSTRDRSNPEGDYL